MSGKRPNAGALRAIAARQHGAFSRAQAVAFGYTRTLIERHRADGRWLTLHRGVYAAAGSPDTWERRASALILAGGTGAVLSHFAAAACLEIIERKPERIDVTTPLLGRRRDPRIHPVRGLSRNDTCTAKGFRVTCPARTLVDLAGVAPAHLLESALDRTLVRGLATVASLRAYIERRNLRHRKGVGRLVKLLDDREFGVPESELERAFERLVKNSHLPMPVRQRPVRRYRVDYLYEAQRIVVEVDGSATRSTKTALQRDRRRQNDIVLDGFLVLRFTWDDVTKDVAYVVATITRALDGAGGGS